MTIPKQLALGWQVGVPSGWGTYGINLAVQLVRKGIEPIIPYSVLSPTLTEAQIATLAPAFEAFPHWSAVAQAGGDVPFPVLHALGDKLDWPESYAALKGQPDVGVVFFESATISAANLARASARFALIITGSSWNADILRRHGFDRVADCPQGVDLELFHPGPRTGYFRDRFAVFSGGKLEYRKGQDLVLAAFKRFHARRPDALLVMAWHNPWPALAQNLSMSPHVTGAPGLLDGKLDIVGWAQANGLPQGSFVDIGPLANVATPGLLREVDLAVFPNRCEGGTNLVAMECMACGVPVVLSRNTGHLDLIRDDNCYALDLQIPIGQVTGRADLEGWGESSIEELAAKMEEAYTNRAEARVRGAAGAAFMQDWDWSRQVDRMLQALDAVC